MILLVVVEVRRHQPGIVLAGRRFKRPEVGAICLATLVDGDVLQVWSRLLDHIQQIAQEGDINGAPVCRRGFLDVSAEDDMRHLIQIAQFLARVFAVQQISRDWLHVFKPDNGSARDCVHRGAGLF